MIDEEDAALARAAHTYNTSGPDYLKPAGAVTTLVMDSAALAYARKWKLIREDGTLKCLHDHCNGDGTLPTLECRTCLGRRTGG